MNGCVVCAAMSSMEQMLIVDSVNGMPAWSAARTPVTSPRLENIPAMPTGASATGIATLRPASTVDVSTPETSRITCWRSFIEAKSARLPAIVSSSLAPPSM